MSGVSRYHHDMAIPRSELTDTEPRGPTRRERLYYVLLSSLGLLATLTLVVLMWYVTPRPRYVALGRMEDFPSGDAPFPVGLGDVRVWVVNTGEQVYIFDQHTPHVTHHRYRWVPLKHRFEDPLTGSKFTLDGEWIEGPAPRDLDQYAYVIRYSMIWLDQWRHNRGAPRS